VTEDAELIKVGLEVAVDRAVAIIKALRNRAMAPWIKRDLDEALKECLLADPDMEKVARAIRNAEALSYDGEELPRARRFADAVLTAKPVGKSKKAAKKRKLKGGASLSSGKGVTKKARKVTAKGPSFSRSSTYKSSSGSSRGGGRGKSSKRR